MRHIFGIKALVTLFCVIIFSCAKSPDYKNNIQPEVGKPVNVELCFKLPPATYPNKGATKSVVGKGFSYELSSDTEQTKADVTTELYNLWLFQFNSDGSINGKPRKISDGVSMVNDMVILDVVLNVSTNQTLYVLALGKYVTADLASVVKKSDLESLPIDYLDASGEYESRVKRDEDIPFAGSVEGVNINAIGDGSRGAIEYNTPEGFGGGIVVKRIMSRVKLKYKFEITDNTVNGVRLLRVPSKIYLGSNIKDVYYVDLKTLPVTDAGDGFYVATWYVAQNKQGNVSTITTESDRSRKDVNGTIKGEAPENGTNIEVWSKINNSSSNYVVHQIYVGNNNTNNFDVDANSFYNIYSIINKADENDGRVRKATAQQKTYVAAFENNNKSDASIGGPTGVYLDAHYSTQPIIIYAHGSKVTVGVYSNEACTSLANPETSWIKISSYPNYTEVVRHKPNSLNTKIETEIIAPTRLVLYAYIDEFIRENGNIMSDNLVRMLYLKVETEDIGVVNPQKKTAIYTFKQQSPVYTGFWGGNIVDGQFQEGLYFDRVDEAAIQYDDMIPKSTPTMRFGYYGVLGALESSQSLYNGKQVTIDMSENVTGALVATGSNIIPEIKPIGGRFDLYQYNYYNTFAARYCYDLNRDENGNGKIDLSELKWYLPAPLQAMSAILSIADKTTSPLGSSLYIHAAYEDLTIAFYVRDLMQGIFGGDAANVQLKSAGRYVRCVRQFEVSDTDKPTVKQISKVKIGVTDYACINSTDLPYGTIDRNAQTDFYDTAELYTYSVGGTTSTPIYESDGVTVKKVKRIKRHILSKNYGAANSNAAYKVSRKFIVSPKDVYSDGDTKSNNPGIGLGGLANSKTMSWATANGWLETADSQAWNGIAKATMTGCSAYKGADNNDPQGSWRVPTQRELALILFFSSYIEAIPGYDKFVRGSGAIVLPAYSQIYWASTQQIAVSTSATIGALVVGAVPWTGAADNSRVSKSLKQTVRCVKDID